jgi:hypothetical protein
MHAPLALQPLAATPPARDCQEIIERIKNCSYETQHGAQYRVCMETYRKVLDCMGRCGSPMAPPPPQARAPAAGPMPGPHAREVTTVAAWRRQEELEYREKQITEPCGPPAAAPG